MAGPRAHPEVSPTTLAGVLADARAAGFLGPGPVDRHVEHARGFVAVARALSVGGPSRPRVVDLGSGGGLPGLVMALEWPTAELVLLEANGRRAGFLSDAVRRLGLDDGVRVVHGRAEVIGRDPSWRATVHGVVSRSFGPPAVVAECAAPLLEVEGWMVVSEPPGDSGQKPERWPVASLATLGLEPTEVVHRGYDYQVLHQKVLCSDTYPRRDGRPAKRPLF